MIKWLPCEWPCAVVAMVHSERVMSAIIGGIGLVLMAMQISEVTTD